MAVWSAATSGQWFQNQFRSDLDGGLQAAIDRAPVGEETVDALRRFPVAAVRFQLQRGMNTPDDQDLVFGFHFAHGFGNEELVGGRNFTRFQRAPESAGKSTRSRRDNVI